MWSLLDERMRRIMAANEARLIGYGGVARVSRVYGLSRCYCEGSPGREKISCRVESSVWRWPKESVERDPKLLYALERLIEPDTLGDPESPLRWVCKSTRSLSVELSAQDHSISHVKVSQLLHAQQYSLQSNRKTEGGEDHTDRDGQFRHINRRVKEALAMGKPVISVDTKKKELLGNYKNAGKQWRPSKQPRKVNGYDFADPSVPRAYPYGVFDMRRNCGFVNVGRIMIRAHLPWLQFAAGSDMRTTAVSWSRGIAHHSGRG